MFDSKATLSLFAISVFVFATMQIKYVYAQGKTNVHATDLIATLNQEVFTGPAFSADWLVEHQAPTTLDRLTDPLLRRDLQIKSSQSCAVSNCHGGPRPGVAQPKAVRGSEYQIWLEDDPHAQSWRTMCSSQSVAIMDRLGIMNAGTIVDQAGFDNCLACHNTTGRYNEPRLPAKTISKSGQPHATELREGVGCAACHGPSEVWGNEHFQHAWTAANSTNDGFVDSSDLYVRARMCASCHVGDKDRDMNHDIIAAGHPVLRYEMATFHGWLPKHWRDAEASDTKCYEPKLWLAGQVAATDASLSLLKARADKSHSNSIWPDLSSFDCSSCHHNLGLKNDRQPFDRHRQATARYSQWNDSGLRWLIQHRLDTGEGTSVDHQLIVALDAVVNAMEANLQPSDELVSMTAQQARQALNVWFDSEPGRNERHCFNSARLSDVVRSAAGKPDNTFRTWESATQYYLAIVAARSSWPDGTAGPLYPLASKMRHGLKYPEMIEVSRYEIQRSQRQRELSPTLTRQEVTQLGSEMAQWFGPVNIAPATNTPQRSVDLDAQIEQVLEQIRQLWDSRTESRQAKIAEIEKLLEKSREVTDDDRDTDKPVRPDRPDKRKEELLEELRQRLKASLEEIDES